MHVRCPHCHNPIELSDIACPSCGSSFSLIEETISHQKAEAKTIGHFDLVEEVGVGAFGSVWKAHDTELDRTVAVKIPRKDQLDATESEQFLREARSAAQLKHPNIVSVFEVGREDGQIYIVSDFVEGLPLSSWLTAKQLTFREAAELTAKIAEALHHAHEAGVIHRDLKPSNIMLDLDGEPHVMDFGLAKRDAGEITMTVDGKVLGTPAYMSPEQARGEAHAADRRTDVYSLGIVLFELLTGERPFRGDFRMLLHQVLNDEPQNPRKLKANLPRDLETICLKCLEKDPQRRYASTKEVADELKCFLAGEPIQARPITAAARTWRWCKRNPTVAGMSVVLVSVLATVAAAGTIVAIKRTKLAAENMRQTDRAQHNLALSRAATSNAIRSKHPIRSLLLAVEAVNTWKDAQGRLAPASEQALQEAVQHVGGVGLAGHSVRAISPDSRWLVTSSYDKTDKMTRLWDLAAEDPAQTARILVGHTDRVFRVAISPNSRWLVTGSNDRTARLWDLTAEDPTETACVLSGHIGPVSKVVISPDSRWLATGGYEKTAHLWDLTAENPAKTGSVLTGHEDAITSLFISNRWLVTWSHPNGARSPVSHNQPSTAEVRLWDLTAKDPATTAQVLAGHEHPVSAVAISSDNRWLVTAGRKPRDMGGMNAMGRSNPRDMVERKAGKAYLWDLTAEDPSKTARILAGREGRVYAVVISPDSRWLVTWSWDKTHKTARLWDLTAEDPTQTARILAGHTDRVFAVVISPNSRWLVTGSLDDTARFWDLTAEQPHKNARVLTGHEGDLRGLFISNRWLVTKSYDGTFRVRLWDLTLWDRDAFTPVRAFGDFLGFGWSISSDSRWLLTESGSLWDSTVQDLTDAARVLAGHDGAILEVAISPDSALFDGNTESKEGAVYVLLMNSDGTVKDHTKISDGLAGFMPAGLEEGDQFGSGLAGL